MTTCICSVQTWIIFSSADSTSSPEVRFRKVIAFNSADGGVISNFVAFEKIEEILASQSSRDLSVFIYERVDTESAFPEKSERIVHGFVDSQCRKISS